MAELKKQLHASADHLNQVVDEFIEDYELYGENDKGEEGTYCPTAQERLLISDAVAGLLSEDDFIQAWAAWRSAIEAVKHAEENDAQMP